MAIYIYKTTLYKNPDLLGLTANSHATNITDFEDNNKSSATEVNAVVEGELTYETEGNYSWFDGTVVDGVTITWSDVKYIDDNIKYVLIITTSDPI